MPDFLSPFPLDNEAWMRGHLVVYRDGKWVFEDDGSPAPFDGGEERPCAKCGESWGRSMFPDGSHVPDPCLGLLPGVKWACCGHGIPGEAYVSLDDGRCLYGLPAVMYFEFVKMRRVPRHLG